MKKNDCLFGHQKNVEKSPQIIEYKLSGNVLEICLPFWIQFHFIGNIDQMEKELINMSFSHKWTNTSLIRFSKLQILSFFFWASASTLIQCLYCQKKHSFFFKIKKKSLNFLIFFSLSHFFRSSYYAIVRPLEYPLYMTNRTVFFMLVFVWLLPALISFTPIFLGWYTTTESLKYQAEHTDDCIFVANKTYAIISSSVSFWIPGLVMITMYCRIYK